jgi:hypothetical protein
MILKVGDVNKNTYILRIREGTANIFFLFLIACPLEHIKD